MNCSYCDNSFNPDAHFCPRCGAKLYQAAPPPFYAAPVRPPRVACNLQALGILWAIYAGIRLVSGTAGLLFAHSFFSNHMGNDWNFGWTPFHHMAMGGWLPIAFTSLLVSVVCAGFTAFALLTRQSWGRVLAIVFGVLALFHPMLGTVLGIYTLWVLAPSASGLEYDGLAAQHRGAVVR